MGDVFCAHTADHVHLPLPMPPTDFPLTLELSRPRLPKQTRAEISQIRTLSVERTGKKLGRVSDQELQQVVEGLNEIL